MLKKDCYFLLKEPKSDNETLIYFFMTCPDSKVKRAIGRKILPADWNTEDQRPFKNKDLNKYLDDIEQVVKDIKSDCRRNKTIISSAMVHAGLDVVLQDLVKRKAVKKVGRTMFEDFVKVTDAMAAGTVLTPGKNPKKYEAGTIVYFEKCTRILKEFFKVEELRPLYSTVTMEVYNDFIVWCHGKNHANSYIGQLIKGWKRLADIALEKGWHSNPVFKSEGFVKITEETEDVFLTEKQILAIYTVELEERHLDIARDWFVMDCFLGVRVSDLQRITLADLSSDVFQLSNQKTGAHVAVPINPIIPAILLKWGGMPPAMSDVKLNKYIKIVGEKAKLNDKFMYSITKGGRLQVITCRVWEMLSAHTARRTLITNLLRSKVEEVIVMRLTGIKRQTTLNRYFKQTPLEVARDLKKHPYFTGK